MYTFVRCCSSANDGSWSLRTLHAYWYQARHAFTVQTGPAARRLQPTLTDVSLPTLRQLSGEKSVRFACMRRSRKCTSLVLRCIHAAWYSVGDL